MMGRTERIPAIHCTASVLTMKMLKPRNRELNPPRCLTVRRILEVISCGFEGCSGSLLMVESGSSVGRGSKEMVSCGDSIITSVGTRRPKVYSICRETLAEFSSGDQRTYHKHGKQEGNKSRDEHDSSPCWDLDLVTMLSVSIKPTSDERSGNVHFDVLLKERR